MGRPSARKLLRGASCLFGCGSRHMNFDRGAAVFVKQLAACALDDRFPDLPIPLLAFSLDVSEASSRSAWARTMSFIAEVTCCNHGSG